MARARSTAGFSAQKNRCQMEGAFLKVPGHAHRGFADTHDRYPPGLPERMKNADEICHLGDGYAPFKEPDLESDHQA